MEENHDRFIVCIFVFFASWIILYCYNRKVDTIVAIGLLNINTLSWVYINGQTNEMSDPDRAHTLILQLFMIGDGISSWLQVISTSEISIVGHIVWCIFGKLCLLISLLVMYDDRWPLIGQYLGVSLVFLTLQSIVQRKVIQSDNIKPNNGILGWV